MWKDTRGGLGVTVWIGRLINHRGKSIPTNLILKNKLEMTWGLTNFKVIPIKGGLYHILLNSLEDQGTVMAKGAINMRPGIFCVSKWFSGFDLTNHN